MTYAKQVRIVDGDDGRIYALELTDAGYISVRQGTLFNHETVWPREMPRYNELASLIGLTPEEIEQNCRQYEAVYGR